MSNLSNVCLSIRSSNNKTSTAKGYASNGKALVSFTNKGGVNTLKAYPKADKVPSYLLMDISIHALREEGDLSVALTTRLLPHFYPRPP